MRTTGRRKETSCPVVLPPSPDQLPRDREAEAADAERTRQAEVASLRAERDALTAQGRVQNYPSVPT
jgi:hypothetical protein